DWSSDVCSSDLSVGVRGERHLGLAVPAAGQPARGRDLPRPARPCPPAHGGVRPVLGAGTALLRVPCARHLTRRAEPERTGSPIRGTILPFRHFLPPPARPRGL